MSKIDEIFKPVFKHLTDSNAVFYPESFDEFKVGSEAKAALYEALAKEAEAYLSGYTIVEAVPLDKIKKMFGIGDDNS